MTRRPKAVWILFLVSLALLSAGVGTAQGAGDELTLKAIMAHPDWIGRSPLRPYWADDSGSFYYERKRPGEEDFDLLHADLNGDVLGVVEDAERGLVDVAGGDLSSDRRRKVYTRHGDIYVRELDSGEIRQLTQTAAVENRPIFLVDGRVAYRRGRSHFIRNLDTGLEVQPFDVRLEEDPESAKAKEHSESDYLRDQQGRLFAHVRDVRDREDLAAERERSEQAADPTRPELPYYLGKDREIREASLSPDGEWLLLRVAKKESQDGRKGLMPRYVTATGYVETEEVRARVGTAADAGESLLLLGGDDRRIVELDLSTLPGISEDPLAELREAARKREEERRQDAGDEKSSVAPPGVEEKKTKRRQRSDAEKKEKEGEKEERAGPRPLRLSHIRWSDDGRQVVFQAFSQDNKDRWIAALDPKDATVRPLHRIHDEAWINWRYRDLGWLRDNLTVYYLSEESGYSHLYLLSVDDAERRPLTEGSFVVDSPTLSPDGRYLYYVANRRHPGTYEVERVEVASGEGEVLTRLGGINRYLLSPSGSYLLLTHSTSTRPPELFVQEARGEAQAKQASWTVSDEFLAVSWSEPEIVAIPSSKHSRQIYSRLYGAADRDVGLRPAVVFVHGAGYLQNAHAGWSSYFREFMFHSFLAQRGYVVLDMDYRASAGYGRDWRTAIYRQMGTPELEDLEDGVAWLAEHHGVDAKRVGVYGGSYGGFLTLMALMKKPELFAAGAALRPVTDWAHYNHRYTSNILNTPRLDPEAYERSSPIEFADGLERPLLICTGMLDDNVFFQDSVRLVQRLIELEKEDWEIAIYPVEAHGFREPSSWLDEYRRIFKLFETELRGGHE